MTKKMTSKHRHRLFLFMIIILLANVLVACSAVKVVPTPTAIATNTIVRTETPIPSAIATLTVEPSPTATLAPTVSLPTEAISSQNISQIKQLDSRELAGKPEEFLPRSMDFTPDGRLIAADYDTIVYVWDSFAGNLINTFDHSIYLWRVAMSPDGKIVASGGESGVLRFWDLKTGKETRKLVHPGTIWSLAFSPDSTMLVSGTLDLERIKIWNVIDGDELDQINDVLVNSVAFSPNGKFVAIGTDDKILLWDISAKKVIKTFVFDLRGGEGLSGIQGVLFSPDGKMIAAADADNIALVWDIASGKKLSTIVGMGTIIRMSEGTLAFSPDSKVIAAGNDNGEILFWDVGADKELQRIGSQECIPMDLIFGTSGSIFEIACQSGTIQFWGVP